MSERIISDTDYNRIFDFWKLEEYFTPFDYPELTHTVKEEDKDIRFDVYYSDADKRKLPLEVYKSHNEYLLSKWRNENKLYDRVNIYCGQYKLNAFALKMAERCNLDIERYPDINELNGRFYLFSVQIDLDGNITDEGVKISPFFYAVIRTMKAKGINAKILKGDISNLNNDINEILKMMHIQILDFAYVNLIKKIVFDKLDILSEGDVGLEAATENIFASKALRKDDETVEFNSFYLSEIEKVQANYKKNANVARYTAALLDGRTRKVMIDTDVSAMQKWLDVDKYPLAKYPSKFSPTLMQQIAINISISEQDRKEKVFSVNGPPGTGKTTLLKEIIASNVVNTAEKLIGYGLNSNAFVEHKVESESNPSYTEKYYEIPQDIAQYGILVVSNNNGAVENVTLNLPKAKDVAADKTMTDHFDRSIYGEVYFSAVADELLEESNGAWGLISARMGRKSFVSKVLNSCIFSRSNDNPEKVTLDSAKSDSISWEQAVLNFTNVKNKVLSIRSEIKSDKQLLSRLYGKEDELKKQQSDYDKLLCDKEALEKKLGELQQQLDFNEQKTSDYEDEIEYIKKHSSIFVRILIAFGLGQNGRRVAEKRKAINELVLNHENIVRDFKYNENKGIALQERIDAKIRSINFTEALITELNRSIYGTENSFKSKYGNNLADRAFYNDIKNSELSQNSCPWTYSKYNEAREELFFAALQVRKAFVLESKFIRRNLFVYESYKNGKYTAVERKEMFSHLFNSLSLVIPVISSTFASVGRFLKDADNQSLGMLIIDESGQATPQSALGAIYRTKRAVVVGDPLQVEPVVTIPKVLIDILADSTGVAKQYSRMDNSAQIFADTMNEFNGMIGERQVGCPLVVHRRCIEPMFSISNMISYDNRMFNKTNDKEEWLNPDKPFLIKKSGWIDIKGAENGSKDHFVKEQAEKVCSLLENALKVYPNLFETDDRIFIISPFRTVSVSMRKYIKKYFSDRYDLSEWVRNCVGTVHTFQGKDANEILFVLGCSEKSTGAINWVVKQANILNVACTRAKYRIAFIGDLDNWKTKKYFSDFIPKLIDKVNI